MKRILLIVMVVPALIVGAGAAFAHHEPEPETCNRRGLDRVQHRNADRRTAQFRLGLLG